ncbi:MAG: RNA methyltransferase [Clostridiales bacterium]|nr:RNA methyltransferase [Clostridiales bacterium]
MKKIQALSTQKGRDTAEWFIVEGEKTVGEIPSSWPVAYFIASDAYVSRASLGRFEQKAPAILLENALFQKLSDTVTPQGIMAVCARKKYALNDILQKNCLLLLGEAIADPGNVGTLIRTADAAGAHGVIFTHGSAGIYNPKIIRATAGSIFHLPVLENAEGEAVARTLRLRKVRLAAAHLKGNTLPYDVDWKSACCLLIGNESRGLSDALSARADVQVRIPMHDRAESLNASVAGGILLYEAVRQRLGHSLRI